MKPMNGNDRNLIRWLISLGAILGGPQPEIYCEYVKIVKIQMYSSHIASVEDQSILHKCYLDKSLNLYQNRLRTVLLPLFFNQLERFGRIKTEI